MSAQRNLREKMSTHDCSSAVVVLLLLFFYQNNIQWQNDGLWEAGQGGGPLC